MALAAQARPATLDARHSRQAGFRSAIFAGRFEGFATQISNPMNPRQTASHLNNARLLHNWHRERRALFVRIALVIDPSVRTCAPS
jgi:hypothetical protein